MLDVSEDPLRLFRVRDAAKFLAISERQTWRLIRSGEIESLKVGAGVRVTREALVAYIKRCPAQSTPTSPSAA